MWTNIRFRKTNSEALLFCLLKTVIKADQTSSFYPSINVILYRKYLKLGNAIANVISSEATKTNKPKARIWHFKSTSGKPFCSRISGLHTFGRKQRLLRSSTIQYNVYDSIYPRLNLESSLTSLCLAVILMYLFSFWDGLCWLIISILDTRLCLTSSTVFQWG